MYACAHSSHGEELRRILPWRILTLGHDQVNHEVTVEYCGCTEHSPKQRSSKSTVEDILSRDE